MVLARSPRIYLRANLSAFFKTRTFGRTAPTKKNTDSFAEVRSLSYTLTQACGIKYNDGVLLNASGGHTLRIRIKQQPKQQEPRQQQ